MFLRKDGCKYYILVFKNLDHETNVAIKNNNNNFSIYQCLSSNDINPLPHLTELWKHIENIEAHVLSEENVLKAFINKLHSITFVDMKKQATDPEFLQLTKLVERLQYIERYFKDLKKSVQETLEIINKSKENNQSGSTQANPLIEKYRVIAKDLENIFNTSANLAYDIKSYVISIDKAKELIQKEEQAMTDFNKNLMSWFS